MREPKGDGLRSPEPSSRRNFDFVDPASEVVEMALAHTVGSKVEAAYRRGDLFEKRRRLMEA